MKIEKLLDLERRLTPYDMYFIRFKKHQKSQLIILSIISILLLAAGLIGIYVQSTKPAPKSNIFISSLSFYILIILLGIGLTIWTINKWQKYKEPIQKRIYRIYHRIKSSSALPKRITDEGIKTEIIRLYLKRNGLLFQNKIEQIINALQFESELPIYQYKFTKIFNSLSLLLLGAFIGETLKPDDIGKNTPPNLNFNQAFDIFKSLLAIAILVWVLVWFAEMTIIKHLHRDWVNKRFKVSLIQSLQEIKLSVDE